MLSRFKSEKELIEYLQDCLRDFPNINLASTVTNYLRRFRGELAAIEFIAQHVKNDPSLKGLNQLVSLYLNSGHDTPYEKLTMLQSIVQQITGNKSSYRCGHCGFTAPILFWNCPSCQHWATIRPIQKVAAEVV